jgi:crotonobetaine/carnitine-CoA ligase
MPFVLSRRFSKSRLWDITRKYGCTTFNLLGGMTAALYADPPRPDDADNPVRLVVSSGMTAAIWKDFERRFGVTVMETYGAAEGGLAINPVGVGPIGSIGKIIPTLKHRIVDEQGNDVPRGEPGELWVRAIDDTPYVVEYFKNPEASASKCAGGWLHMGDIVREDADGWLYFLYRAGGGIRRNGDFISPSFIEKAIAEFGAVDDVHVYGVPSRGGTPGEKDIVAAVVPRDAASFDPKALLEHCVARLDRNAVPSYIQVVREMPKTASEKVQERFLVDLLHQDAAAVFVTGR